MAGPVRQRSLAEWNIGGGSISEPIGTESNASTPVALATLKRTRDQCVLPDEDPNRPITIAGDDNDKFDLMGEGEGDEDDGGEEEDDGEDDGDGDSPPKRRANRPLPPAVKIAYEKNLEYLKQASGPQSKPRLYEVHQTFWIPRKSNYFLLHGAAKPRPETLYNHRWFYWDPDHLVEGGLRCPICSTLLHRHGFTRPRGVVDLKEVFYVIGQQHQCLQCRNPTTNEKSVTFNSWDPRIMKALLPDLTAEFPAALSHRNAIAQSVLATM
jgi:hypothetical protein